jgi:hypothetical protein
MLDYSPQTPFISGMEKFVAWYRNGAREPGLIADPTPQMQAACTEKGGAFKNDK